MKNSIEIEKLSEEYWDKQPYNEDAFIAGYNKCLVDMGNTLNDVSITKYTKDEYITKLSNLIKALEKEIIENQLGIDCYAYVQMMSYTEKLLNCIPNEKRTS
jgi:hypothetical protein